MRLSRLALVSLAIFCAFATYASCGAVISVRSTKRVASSPAVEAQPAWFGDGSRLAFVSGRDGMNEIWMLDVLTGNLQKLVRCESEGEFASNPSLAWHVDLLAFVSNRFGNIDVWLLELSTGKLRRMTDSPGIDWMPAISPDGKRIAFVSDRDGADAIWLLDLDGTDKARKLRHNAWEPAWSPDGRQLAFVAKDDGVSGIWVMDLYERKEKLLLPDGRSPSWSPDGKWLCAVRRIGRRYELVIISSDGGTCKAIEAPGENPSSPSWSPKGNMIAYDAMVDGNREIFLLELERKLPHVQITSPRDGARVEGVVKIRATVKVPYGKLKHLTLEYGRGAEPTSWTEIEIKDGVRQVEDEHIATWDVTQLSGTLTLRLRAYDEENDSNEDRVTVLAERVYGVSYVEHTVPEEMLTLDAVQVLIKLRNTGKLTWLAAGRYAVTLSYRWKDENGFVVMRGERFALPKAVNESEEVQVTATVVAPSKPGTYTLEWDLCHGGAIWFSEEGCETLNIPVRVVKRYAAQVVWHNAPKEMAPGQIYTVRVRVRNIGAMTWDGKDAPTKVLVGYHWLDQNGARIDEEPILTPIGEDVKPGEMIEMSVRVRSPSVPGEYSLLWDLALQGQAGKQSWFSDFGDEFEAHPVSVKVPYAVAYLWHNTPRTMYPGQIYLVNLRLRNIGAVAWESKGLRCVAVVYRWFNPEGKELVTPTIETPVPYDVMPGETVEVAARVQAPPVSGNYTLHWDLLRAGNMPFSHMGSPTLRVEVMVQRPICVAEFQPIQHPTVMVVGHEYEVGMTLTNLGTMTWMAAGEHPVTLSYHWLDANGNELKGVVRLRTPLPRDVGFKEGVTLKARVRAPKQVGLFVLRWDLHLEGVGWFSERGSPSLNVPVKVIAEYDYEIVSHDIPGELISGQTYRVKVHVKNRGALTWRAVGEDIVQLGYRWVDEKGAVFEFGILSNLPKDIQMDDSVELDVPLKAPKKAGAYTLKVDMVRGGKIWFEEQGAKPLTLQVQIK
ncbi:MAG: NBR1-Ig-like domain-containing protein [Armatimonadetes bacterium]|nr:NBR1-Ig-like domain-containing protein [Armatimonadota bacterium]